MVNNPFKAPYAAMLALMSVAAGVFLIWGTPLHETAFAYGAGIVGAFLTAGVLACAVRAYRTALLLGACALGLFCAIAAGIDAESFKDMAMKGLAGGIAAGIGVMLKTLLDRFRTDEE